MNTDKWVDVFAQHREALIRCICRILPNREDAEECVQETFISCMKAPPPHTDYKSYLYAAAINTAFNRKRQWGMHFKKIANLKIIGEVFGLPPETPEKLLSEAETELFRRAQVSEAVEKLSPRQKEAVVLYYFQEQKAAAGAEAMGCTKDTVKANRLFGLRSLKKQLQQYRTDLVA